VQLTATRKWKTHLWESYDIQMQWRKLFWSRLRGRTNFRKGKIKLIKNEHTDNTFLYKMAKSEGQQIERMEML